MSNTQESCVSTQDTFRRIETEEKTSSVSALVSRLNTCSVSDSGSGLKNDNLRLSKDDDRREDTSLVQTFPWLPKINDLCRSSVGSKNIKTLENLLTVYLQKVTASVKECYLKPNRAGKLKTCMNDTLVFFHFLYQDIKESVDNTLYLEKMTELMAMYIDLEIKSARRHRETPRKVVSRMTSALNIFLDRSENHILDAIIKAKYITTNNKEICNPILEKLLTSLRTYNMHDTLYVRYLLVFKLWKKIVADANQRKEINKLAIARLVPPDNFSDRFKRFNNVLPKMLISKKKGLTLFYMMAAWDVRKACQNFMKISKDPMQPVMIDKPLFFEGRSQSTFSGKGNAFDGGVSRNLMNEIWSSPSEETAASNKKTKDNSTSKKKTKKDSLEKDKKKKKKTKSESTDFSESNSPPDLSVCHSGQDSLSMVDAVMLSANVDQTFSFNKTAFNSARTSLRDVAPSVEPTPDHLPLLDSSTSRTTQDVGTTRLQSYFETQPVQISTSQLMDVKPCLQSTYNCTVTSGMFKEDQKPRLETLKLHTASDINSLMCKGETIMPKSDEVVVGLNFRENVQGQEIDELITNNTVAIKIEDNQDKSINEVVDREANLLINSKPQTMNAKAIVMKKEQTKPIATVISIEDPPVPEMIFFKECDQLGDQDLPYIEEEVVEPCNTENDADLVAIDFDDKIDVSVGPFVLSSDCEPVESHLVSSSLDDNISASVEQKPVRIALKNCIPLGNVRQNKFLPRLKIPSPNPAMTSQSHISSSLSSPHHSSPQSFPMDVSSLSVQESSPQPIAYSQQQVKVSSPQPVYSSPSIQVPSPQPPAFKVPALPPPVASPTKVLSHHTIPPFQTEVLQEYNEVVPTIPTNEPELYSSLQHSLAGPTSIPPAAVESFTGREMFNYEPMSLGTDDYLLPFNFSCSNDDFFTDFNGFQDFTHACAIDPKMLKRRPLNEVEEFVEPSTTVIDPMELSNARAVHNFLTSCTPPDKWSYSNSPANMPFMAGDDDLTDYSSYSSMGDYPTNYREREYLSSADNTKARNEVLSSGLDSSSSQLNSMYRNSIPETCDKDSLSRSYRMTNHPVNSANNSFPLEETGANLRKPLESSVDSLPKSSIISYHAASGHTRPEKSAASRSKNSVRQRHYDTTTSTNKKAFEPDVETGKNDALQANSTLMACSVQLAPLRPQDISQSLNKAPARGGMLINSLGRPCRLPTVQPYHIPVPYAIPNPAGPGKPPLFHCRDCFIHIHQQYLLYKYNASLQANRYQQVVAATNQYPSSNVTQSITREQSDTEENEEIRKMVKEYEMRKASETKRAAELDVETDVDQTDLESRSKLDLKSSLPPKKRHKIMAIEKPPVSFPSYPTRPMMSIAELEEEKMKLQVTSIQNNELENAKKREEIIARYKKPVKVPFDQLKPVQTVIEKSVPIPQEKLKVIQPARSYPAPTRATSENVNFAGNFESSGRTFKTPGQLKEHNSFNYRASPYIGEYGQIVYPHNYNESMSQKESMILKRLSYVEEPKPNANKVNILDLSVVPEDTSKERKGVASSKRKSKEKPNAGTRSSKRKNQSVIKKTGSVESTDSKRRRKDASR